MFCNRKAAAYAIFAAICVVLGACEGSRGPQGPEGPTGPPGLPGTPGGQDISNAAEIHASIDDIAIVNRPVVEFRLTDGFDNPVIGLPASAVSFKLAKLVPGTDGNPSAWQSYINRLEVPGVGPGTEPKIQATTENGSNGDLVDHADGSYTYTFALDITNVTDPMPVSFAPTLTHRVSLEVRGFAPVRNPVFTWRPSDGAMTDIFTREIVATDSCNACHQNLSLHGGARFEVQDCVVCHNPGTTDANSGNNVDLAVMVHKIHMGANLPSVVAGGDYCIYGFSDTLHCFGDVVFPQSIRNCTTCHDAENPATPDARNWFSVPSDTRCGACHDDVDFATGVGHGPGIPASNSECATCHVSDSGSGPEVRQVHRDLATERRANYSFNILNVDFAGPGTAPIVTFSVTDPANEDAPYDLDNDAELTASSLRFLVAWDTTDYSNAGNGQANSQPVRTDVYADGMLQATNNGDYTYSLTLGTVAPAVVGTGVVIFEGSVSSTDGRVPVTSSFEYFSITDDPVRPVERRAVVDIERCDACHDFVSFHGGGRNDRIEACQVCHNADAARSGDPSAGPMDIKHFIHRKHAVDPIRYPQPINNCTACHTDDGFYPVASDSGVLATSFNRGGDTLDPTDNNRASPNSAVCSVCHASSDARSHMIGNGGSFDVCQELDGTARQRIDMCGPAGDKSGALVTEACTVCHGPGRIADVARFHGL